MLPRRLRPIRIGIDGVGGLSEAARASCIELIRVAGRCFASFDVDACCFVYDGERVLASARGLRALIERTNRVDPARRSLTYESRLIKYALRGFSVFVPPRLYKPSAVDPRVYDLCLALREHHPRCLAATPKTPETPAGRRLLAAAALRRTRDPVFGDGGEKPSGLVRLIAAIVVVRCGDAAGREVTQTKKKRRRRHTSLRDVLRRGWCYNRQKTPPCSRTSPDLLLVARAVSHRRRLHGRR